MILNKNAYSYYKVKHNPFMFPNKLKIKKTKTTKKILKRNKTSLNNYNLLLSISSFFIAYSLL